MGHQMVPFLSVLYRFTAFQSAISYPSLSDSRVKWRTWLGPRPFRPAIPAVYGFPVPRRPIQRGAQTVLLLSGHGAPATPVIAPFLRATASERGNLCYP